jgi:broad specificity phosphatase PhoE
LIVALLRHGATPWNEARRLQGRADVALSPAGREQVAAWRLPPEFAAAELVSSPLARAVETARIVAGREPAIAPDLIEMDWGAWEGETFASLREHHAEAFAAAEARGLDFRPPRGESMREAQQRVLRWIGRIAVRPGPVVAVTHKGVLNVLVAHLTGWNAIGRSPVKLRPGTLHLFDVDAGAGLRVRAWNVALAAGTA